MTAAPAIAQMSAAGLTGPYRIAGTVVNAVTGAPVEGAMVALLTVEDSHTFASTETGGDGHFDLESLPAAKYQLTASKRGFCTSYYDEHEEYNSAIVTGEGQETGDLVFKLTPAAVLSGVVTADGGDAVEGATVMLFEKPRGHAPDAKIEQAGTATTDDTGAYEFPNLTAGEYLLAVKAQPWYAINRFDTDLYLQPETEQQAALDVAYPVTYFDSTTDEGSATPIVLAGGSRQEANIILHTAPAIHLEVPAPRKQDGSIARPELRQTIFGLDASGGGGFMSRMRDGITDFGGVAPGSYELTEGDPPRVVELNATASQQVDPNAGAATVTVNVNLRNSLGAPFKGAMTADLVPADGSGLGAVEVPIAGSGPGFIFPSVPAGVWALSLSGRDGPLPVLSIAAGGRAQAGNRVAVQDRPLTLEVAVSAAATRIEGFAHRNSKGFAGAMVVLVPKNLSLMASLARRDQSDSDGSFALLNVVPGAYTVVAIEDGWEVDWGNPSVMARYLPGGVAVTVKDESDNGTPNGPGTVIRLPEPVTVQAR